MRMETSCGEMNPKYRKVAGNTTLRYQKQTTVTVRTIDSEAKLESSNFRSFYILNSQMSCVCAASR